MSHNDSSLDPYRLHLLHLSPSLCSFQLKVQCFHSPSIHPSSCQLCTMSLLPGLAGAYLQHTQGDGREHTLDWSPYHTHTLHSHLEAI